MRGRCLSSLLLALLFLSFSHVDSVQAEVVYTSEYPTRVKVREYQERGITRLVIASRFFPNHTRVGYPSRTQSMNLNSLSGLKIDIRIDVTQFPSRQNRKYLNSLGEHISLVLTIRNCLSSRSEASRISDIDREISVRNFCNTYDAYKEALEYAQGIMEENPHIKIKVFRVEDGV